jgi:hypothetical protein
MIPRRKKNRRFRFKRCAPNGLQQIARPWHVMCRFLEKSASLMKFQLPTRRANARNEERKVGFEFEYSGISPSVVAAFIAKEWGGRMEEENRFRVSVIDTQLGDFEVALDARLLKDERYLGYLRKMGLDPGAGDRDWWEDLLEDVASVVVPYEIGMPPLPLSALGEAERLRQLMREQGALGTKARYRYAFGMHINAEVPDLEPGTVLNGLRSFLLHYPWLLEELEIDWARRITPFIRPFPDAYWKQVLDPAYHPGREEMTGDYLGHNATRNRPLDLLPILCLWNEGAIREAMPDEKVKARPTFHYRMPNCLFDDPEWRVARDWNRWVRIEELAFDAKRLEPLCRQLLSEMDEAPLLWASRWARTFPAKATYE